METLGNHFSLSGCGIGLRTQHSNQLKKELASVPWLEVLADNHMVESGPLIDDLIDLSKKFPVTLHCVGLSIGSTDEIDFDYLNHIKTLAEKINARMISDHLAWTSVHGRHFHELLPLPYTKETVDFVATRIRKVQETLEQQISIENVSSYLNFEGAEYKEWEFVGEIVEKANCGILLDINNIYVNATNHEFLADDYLSYLPPQRITQFHLGGHEERDGYLLDSHASRISAPVWSLFRNACERFGPRPTIIEWDNEVPELKVLLEERAKAESILGSLHAHAA